GYGFLEAQPLVGPFASGAPAIFISQFGRLCGKAAMVGAVGDDDFGRVNTYRLKRDGVDVSTISIDPDYPTGSGQRRFQWDNPD
ncbi:PfkB family carbohydrate kinase, partial [Rhizobium ruizarguesonis]